MSHSDDTSSSPFPTSVRKKEEPLNDVSDNAMWRISDWFPNLDPAVMEQIKIYHSELLKFNSRLNLISRNTEREADEVHFADCLMAAELLKEQGLGPKVFDVGSGNGLPGLLFAIFFPNTEFLLVESDARKCEFLKHVIFALKLPNAQVVNARLESLKDAGMTVCVSRGFATISKTVLTCNRLFSGGGRFYHLKGGNWSSEIAELPSQLISVWSPELVGEYSLPVTQARRAIVVTTKVK